jgi:hypothetical protein
MLENQQNVRATSKPLPAMKLPKTNEDQQQQQQPDYIRYHKNNNLDMSYFNELKKDDGFDFRKPIIKQKGGGGGGTTAVVVAENRPSQFLREFDEELESPRESEMVNNGNVMMIAPPES